MDKLKLATIVAPIVLQMACVTATPDYESYWASNDHPDIYIPDEDQSDSYGFAEEEWKLDESGDQVLAEIFGDAPETSIATETVPAAEFADPEEVLEQAQPPKLSHVVILPEVEDQTVYDQFYAEEPVLVADAEFDAQAFEAELMAATDSTPELGISSSILFKEDETTVIEMDAELAAPELDQPQNTLVASNDPQSLDGDRFGVYEIKEGDTLSELSLKIYGTSKVWQNLANDNAIDASGKIIAGSTLKVRLVGEAIAFFEAAGEDYQVLIASGDTLMDIARSHLGTTKAWRDLMSINKKEINHPDHLPAGQALWIPALA